MHEELACVSLGGICENRVALVDLFSREEGQEAPQEAPVGLGTTVSVSTVEQYESILLPLSSLIC